MNAACGAVCVEFCGWCARHSCVRGRYGPFLPVRGRALHSQCEALLGQGWKNENVHSVPQRVLAFLWLGERLSSRVPKPDRAVSSINFATSFAFSNNTLGLLPNRIAQNDGAKAGACACGNAPARLSRMTCEHAGSQTWKWRSKRRWVWAVQPPWPPARCRAGRRVSKRPARTRTARPVS